MAPQRWDSITVQSGSQSVPHAKKNPKDLHEPSGSHLLPERRAAALPLTIAHAQDREQDPIDQGPDQQGDDDDPHELFEHTPPPT